MEASDSKKTEKIREYLKQEYEYFNLVDVLKEKGFSEKMQLCNSFFWKGKIGNYHDFLSRDDVQKIVDYNFEVMKEFGYIDTNNNLTV